MSTKTKLTVGTISACVGIICVVVGALGAYFLTDFTSKQNSKDIMVISETQKDRADHVDRQFNNVQISIDSVKLDISEIKKDVAVSHANQTIMMNQISQMQFDMKSFYTMVLRDQASLKKENLVLKRNANYKESQNEKVQQTASQNFPFENTP